MYTGVHLSAAWESYYFNRAGHKYYYYFSPGWPFKVLYQTRRLELYKVCSPKATQEIRLTKLLLYKLHWLCYTTTVLKSCCVWSKEFPEEDKNSDMLSLACILLS